MTSYFNAQIPLYPDSVTIEDEINQLRLTSAVAGFIQEENHAIVFATSDVGPGSDHNLILNTPVIIDRDTGDISNVKSLSFQGGQVSPPVPGSMWLNSSNNHIYHGGVDLEATGGDVTGPMSSIIGEISIFGDISGDFIDGSGVIINNKNMGNLNSLSFDSNVSEPVPDSLWLNSGNNHLYHGTTDLEGFGNGDVIGPMTSADNELTRFSGLTGKIIKGSSVLLDNSKNLNSINSAVIDSNLVQPVVNSLWNNNGVLYHDNINLEKEGDVVGPAVTLNNEIPLFSGTNGKLLKKSTLLVDSAKNVSTFNSLLFQSSMTNPVSGSLWLNSANNHLYHDNQDIELDNGDVFGPATSTSSGLALFADTTGKLLKDCSINIDDDSNMLDVNSLSLIPNLGPPIFGSIWLNSSTDHIMHNFNDLENQGDVVGPASATLNELALFSNINGKVIAGSGINFASVGDVKGPASSSNNEVAIYSGTTGKIIKNSSILSSNLGNVFGPVSAVNNNLCAFDTTTGKLIKDSGISVASLSLGSAVITDSKPANTNGGTFNSGAWRKRDLTTISTFGSSGVSLAVAPTSQITLLAGTYRISGYAPARNVQSHQCRLQNVTDGVTSIIGESQFTQDATGLLGIGGGIAVSNSQFDDIITIASTKVFELQHECSNSQATNGFGVATNFGLNCIYSKIFINKLA